MQLLPSQPDRQCVLGEMQKAVLGCSDLWRYSGVVQRSLTGKRRSAIDCQRTTYQLLLPAEVHGAYARAWLAVSGCLSCWSADRTLLVLCEQALPDHTLLQVQIMNEDGTYNLCGERIGSPEEPDGCHIVSHSMKLVGVQIERLDLRPTRFCRGTACFRAFIGLSLTSRFLFR